MMDEQNTAEFADVSELDTVAQEIKQQESAASSEQKSVIEDILPEEFRGKSIREISDIALHARREMGKAGNELGEVRRLADELIKSTLQKHKEQEVSNEVDFFENPQEAIRRAVDNNPTVQQAANYAVQAQQTLAKQRFYQLHPDADQLVHDQAFNDWIGKSTIRQQLFVNANNYDINSAHELFSTYKELRSAHQSNVSDVEKAARGKAMTAAGVDTGGSGEKSKKIFRRTEVLKIMAYDKKKYALIKDEIDLAYREGRVR